MVFSNFLGQDSQNRHSNTQGIFWVDTKSRHPLPVFWVRILFKFNNNFFIGHTKYFPVLFYHFKCFSVNKNLPPPSANWRRQIGDFLVLINADFNLAVLFFFFFPVCSFLINFFQVYFSNPDAFGSNFY